MIVLQLSKFHARKAAQAYPVSWMTSEEEERRPPAKKRKLNQNSRNGEFLDNSETFYPFRLVPSPQEARTLETGTKNIEIFLMDS